MAKYKFENPFDWLAFHISKETQSEEQLKAIILEMARVMCSDDIQDLFQDLMEDDGYFEEI